jgi:iron complex outermembrane receptor protein
MKRALAICCASFAAWSVVTPALAQSVPPAAASPQEEQIGDIIVTAQRRSESAESAPLAITAISGKDLQSAGINSIEGLSQSIPNVEFGSNAADAKIFIRGVGYDSIYPGGETRVAVYDNNVYESRSQAAFTTLYDIDRVEVLRGPQGTLYGRNAVAGAINIITADPGAQLNGYVSGQAGNYGLIQTEGAIGGPVTQWLGARVAYQTVDRDGYGHNIGTGEQVNDDHSRSVRLTLLAKLADDVQDRFVADFYDENDHNFGYRYLGYSYPEDVPGPVVFGARVPTNLQDAAGQGPLNHLEAYGVSNELSVSVNKLLTLTSVTGYRHLTSELADSVYGGVPDLGIQLLYENSNSVTQEVRLSGSDSIFKYVIGGYYFYEDHVTDNRAPFNALTFGGPNQFVQFYNAGGTEKTNAFAGFGQADIEVLSGLTLSVGLRYSHEKKDLNEFESVDLSTPYDITMPIGPLIPTTGLTPKTASYTSHDPRFSLSYQFNPRLIGYVTYSQGFKSGGFNIGGLQAPFAPERIKDYEFGLKGDYLDRRLRANIAAFYYDYSNLQVNETQGLSEQTINAATAKVKGVEAELTALPTTHLRVSLNAAWLDATYTHFNTEDPARLSLGTLNLAGNYLNYAPKYKVGLDVAYTIPSPYGDFTPTADVNWTDRLYFTPFNTPLLSQPAHTNLDLSIRWVGVNPVWTGSLFARNVTNKIYITGAGVNNPLLGFDRNGQVSAPRTFGIEVTRHF